MQSRDNEAISAVCWEKSVQTQHGWRSPSALPLRLDRITETQASDDESLLSVSRVYGVPTRCRPYSSV